MGGVRSSHFRLNSSSERQSGFAPFHPTLVSQGTQLSRALTPSTLRGNKWGERNDLATKCYALLYLKTIIYKDLVRILPGAISFQTHENLRQSTLALRGIRQPWRPYSGAAMKRAKTVIAEQNIVDRADTATGKSPSRRLA